MQQDDFQASSPEPNEDPLFKWLDRARLNGFTPMLWGPPGVGKTQRIKAWAKSRGLRVIILTVSQIDAVDARGLPSILNGRTICNRPSWLPTEENCVVFLDEFTNGSPPVMRAFYELVLEHRIGDHVLHPSCMVICAGNRPEDRAAIQPLPLPLANRLWQIDVAPELSLWISYAESRQFPRVIVDFITLYPEFLYTKPNANAGADSAFATPRSWESVATLLDYVGNDRLDFEQVRGFIGSKAAREFLSFIRIGQSLADLKAQFEDPASMGAAPPWEEFQHLVGYICSELREVHHRASHGTARKSTSSSGLAHNEVLDMVVALTKHLDQDRIEFLIREVIQVSDLARDHRGLRNALQSTGEAN